jgi:hypothetical protein
MHRPASDMAKNILVINCDFRETRVALIETQRALIRSRHATHWRRIPSDKPRQFRRPTS